MSTPPIGPSAGVAVVLTTYNEERFLRAAVEGVLSQRTTFPVDLIVIDDGSTDQTPALLRDYQRRYPGRVHARLLGANTGDNAAFMEAIHEARAPYVALLDGDDYWTADDKLQSQVERLEGDPGLAMCYHNVAIEATDDPVAGALAHAPDHPELLVLDDLLEWCDPYTCSVVIRRSAIGAIPAWYRDDVCADWSLFLLAARHGGVAYLPRTMATYRRHPAGFWSRRDAVARHRVVADFYRDLPGRIGESHGHRIAQLRTSALLQLAGAAHRGGLDATRDQALAEALAVVPSASHAHWALRTALGARAQFGIDAGSPPVVWLEVQRPVPSRRYDVQLTCAHFAVERGVRYVVSCRARADREPHPLTLGCGAAHDPWHGLGLYHEVTLSPTWRDVVVEFTASQDEPDARLHIDAGGAPGRLEITELALTRVTGDAVQPTLIPGWPGA